MYPAAKYVEKGLSVAANGAWAAFSRLNRVRPGASFIPSWSELPLLKSHQKTKPPLGWPRETDSLCPTCVREARQAILDGLRLAASAKNTSNRRPRAPARGRQRARYFLMQCSAPRL